MESIFDEESVNLCIAAIVYNVYSCVLANVLPSPMSHNVWLKYNKCVVHDVLCAITDMKSHCDRK